jgi:hypothetical protein
MHKKTHILLNGLKLLLKPVVRFCLRHSLRIQDFLEVGKIVFAEVANEQLEPSGKKLTDSRLSVMTGLHRRDVVRLRGGEGVLVKAEDVVSRVIGQWQGDKRYLLEDGSPKVLSYGSEQSEFSKLVHFVSNDISASSVLEELVRTSVVKKTEEGLVLLKDFYIPKGNIVGGFKILSDDISDLTQAVEENMLLDLQPPHMHFRTTYDRIDPGAKDEIKKWLLEQGRELHLKARQYLSQFDLDINPHRTTTETPERVVLSSYSLLESKEK